MNNFNDTRTDMKRLELVLYSLDKQISLIESPCLHPIQFLSMDGSTEMVDIENLCKKMYMQGYRYATFLSTRFGDLSHNEDKETNHFPNDGTHFYPRPVSACYFSELENFDHGEGEINHAPQWYYHVVHELLSARFKNRDIAFAKFKPLTLMKDTSKFLAHHKKINEKGIPTFNWPLITQTFRGIIVSSPEIRDSGWGVNTVAVWNFDCLQEVKIFKNVGEYKYNPVPVRT